MDNQRGLENGGTIGEVVDMQTGEVENVGLTELEAGENKDAGERRPERKGAGQAMPSAPASVVMKDDASGVGENIQSDLVNLTTKDGEGIEKVWIDRGRRIMKETRDDPRKREDEFFELKKNFIFKRFGRRIGGEKK